MSDHSTQLCWDDAVRLSLLIAFRLTEDANMAGAAEQLEEEEARLVCSLIHTSFPDVPTQQSLLSSVRSSHCDVPIELGRNTPSGAK